MEIPNSYHFIHHPNPYIPTLSEFFVEGESPVLLTGEFFSKSFF